MLVHYGFLRNTQMEDVLMGKYTVQIPDKDGNPPSEPSEQSVAVIMLGVRNNQCVIPVYFYKLLFHIVTSSC